MFLVLINFSALYDFKIIVLCIDVFILLLILILLIEISPVL